LGCSAVAVIDRDGDWKFLVATLTTASAPSVNRLAATAQDAPPKVVAAATRLLHVATDRREGDRVLADVLDMLADATENAEAGALGHAESGYELLWRLLEQPEALAALRPRDPLASARLRGLRLKRQILEAEGGTVTAEALAGALGMSRQAVDKRRRRGALIALSLGKRGLAYPVWQVGLDGLPAVLRELHDLDPWTQAAFMLAPNRWLDGETPLTLLRRGEREGVVAAARLYGEQVAA
jgi:hypothetical protein